MAPPPHLWPKTKHPQKVKPLIPNTQLVSSVRFYVTARQRPPMHKAAQLGKKLLDSPSDSRYFWSNQSGGNLYRVQPPFGGAGRWGESCKFLPTITHNDPFGVLSAFIGGHYGFPERAILFSATKNDWPPMNADSCDPPAAHGIPKSFAAAKILRKRTVAPQVSPGVGTRHAECVRHEAR